MLNKNMIRFICGSIFFVSLMITGDHLDNDTLVFSDVLSTSAWFILTILFIKGQPNEIQSSSS